MLKVGQEAVIIDNETRLPVGTHVIVVGYIRHLNEVLIRNVDSEYICWAKPHNIRMIEEKEDAESYI